MIHVTPEYFPRLETLLPLLQSEHAVWRSDRPFSRGAWQNRTRLRNADGWQWITVPVEHGQLGQSIEQTRIAYHDGWRKRHLKALQYNYSTTPFHIHFADGIQALLDDKPTTLGALNRGALDLVLSWLKHEVEWASPTSGNPDAPQIGGHGNAEFVHPEYRQNYDGFIPQMSCLDILFNHGPAAIHEIARSR